MAKNLEIYRCSDCGYMLEVVDSRQKNAESHTHTCDDAAISCCGKEMKLLEANTVEASAEKHLPVAAFEEDHKLVVKVGSVPHPMIAEHYIQWVCLVYGETTQRIKLEAGQAPEATFCIDDVTEVDIYEYCNLHGLWKSTIKK